MPALHLFRRRAPRPIPALAGFLLLVTAAATLVAFRARPSALPFYRTAALTPEWLSAREADRQGMHRVGAFALTDQRGRTLTEADVRGRVYVASFFFTTCRGLCPNLYTNLATVARAFTSDTAVHILSHTVTPEIDDVATLAAYAARHRIDGDRWHLLTGTPAALRRLAHDDYFVQLSDTAGTSSGTMLHTETLVLVDGAGRLRGVYDGSLAFDTQRLIDDIRTLRSEHD